MILSAPDQLKQLWNEVADGRLSRVDFAAEQDRLLGEYRQRWQEALLLRGEDTLTKSALVEISRCLGIDDLREIEQRCTRAVAALREDWEGTVQATDPQSIHEFYHASENYIYDLMWWHTLTDDESPLAYVVALDLATEHQCHAYLDFGAGVGTGGLLFARHSFAVTLADISTTLLSFSRTRLTQRGIEAQFLDLRSESLPARAFDFITAMDVFEHLVEPLATVDQLVDALRPGGLLFGRFHAEADPERPQHIVQDFGPTFARLAERGMKKIWADEWLWGHELYRKEGGE